MYLEKDKRRGERRDRTRAYGLRTRRVHLRFAHLSWLFPERQLDCVCELSTWYFRKAKPFACRRWGRLKGNPKVQGMGCGPDPGEYRRAVRERIQGKRLARQWLRHLGAMAPEDIEL